MKNFLHTLVLLSFFQMRAGNECSLPETIEYESDNEKIDPMQVSPLSDYLKEHPVLCVKCLGYPGYENLIPCCNQCQARICSTCDIASALKNTIYLDSTRDILFYKLYCKVCQQETRAYGFPDISTMRQFILMDRVNSLKEEYKIEPDPIQLFLMSELWQDATGKYHWGIKDR